VHVTFLRIRDFGNSELASRKANSLTVYDYNLSISKLYSKKNLEVRKWKGEGKEDLIF
jgi:hypothetical protein